MTKFKTPTIYIAFGITGDLFKNKILPALYDLYLNDLLPSKFSIVGFSRRSYTNKDLQKYLLTIMVQQKYKYKSKYIGFLKLFSYVQGNFDDKESYLKLNEFLGLTDKGWRFCSNKLFHLSVPPNYYHNIFVNLKKSGLTKPCGGNEGWTRIMVEKPFGQNLQTAKELEKELSKSFKEEQIYRIDHYLAKESLQNILHFRFSNVFTENSWNDKYIEKISVKILESVGVEERGKFYDGVGALRDIGQNHLLQMLASVTMDKPKELNENYIKEQREKLLSAIKPLSKKQVKLNTVRAQYKRYKQIEEVNKNSTTETYFKIKTKISNKRWKNTLVELESGKKAIPNNKKSIVKITLSYRHPNDCFCDDKKPFNKNKVVFESSPDNCIKMTMWYKKPGLSRKLTSEVFKIKFGKTKDFVLDYEKLIYDCIVGDQTLFVSSKEVFYMWNFVDSILKHWNKNEVPLQTYKEGDIKNIS